MIIPMVNYNVLLEHAKDFYSYCAEGDADLAEESIQNFFNKSNKINPSVAKMALQQAQNDVFAYQYRDFYNDKPQLNQRKGNIKRAMFQLNRYHKNWDLDNRVKEIYPKSAKKRLAIIPCLLDGEVMGLANVNQAKLGKKIQYFLRKLITK